VALVGGALGFAERFAEEAADRAGGFAAGPLAEAEALVGSALRVVGEAGDQESQNQQQDADTDYDSDHHFQFPLVRLELLLEVVGFIAVVLGELALALGSLGRFPSRFLVILRLAGVYVGLGAVAAGLFAEALAFPFAPGAALAAGKHGENQQDGDNDDYGDDQSG
jgi:hypothetical protein